MTTIAWDGKILAVDKQASCGNLICRTTKVKKLFNGHVVAWSGILERGLILCKWYNDGCDVSRWPEFQKDENWVILVIASIEKIITYNAEPIAQEVEDPFSAWGSGCEFALGAMAAGKNAIEAVEIASRFDNNSGCGVDYFIIKP